MKCKLKFGDIITTENGLRWVYGGNDGALSETDILKKTYIRRYEPFISNQKIIKVERYVQLYNFHDHGIRIPMNYYCLKTIYEAKEILDEAEKRYLNNVIKPFKKRVKKIVKCDFQCEEYIKIDMINSLDDFCLPSFKKGTMYKGMKLEKDYTLKELGLED